MKYFEMKSNKSLKFIGLFYIWTLCFLIFFCMISLGIGMLLDILFSEQDRSLIFGTSMSIERLLFALAMLVITSILVFPLWTCLGNKIFPNLKFNERFREFWHIMNKKRVRHKDIGNTKV